MPKNHAGGFSGSVDSFYDPEFTVQISTKMQVPDKISVIEGSNSKDDQQKSEEPKVYMHVPERIIVAGGNEHIAARDPLPELRLESKLPTASAAEVLTTPPRVLTLNEYEYPSVDVDQPVTKLSTGNCIADVNSSHLDIHLAPEEELRFLSAEMKLMRKRIAQLEMENQARSNREIILYSFGIVYFLLKGVWWLNRHL